MKIPILHRLPQMLRLLLTGALAGAFSAIIFTWIHDLTISDIWFMLFPMMIAGALCGLSVVWTYALVRPEPEIRDWLIYNGVYLLMFVLLTVVSVIVFEPITTIVALLKTNGPPNELIGEAMPMTVGFTLGMAILMAWRWGTKLIHLGSFLVTCVVLVALLGLNISVIGLVKVPTGSFYLVLEMFGLIAILNIVFVSVFTVLEWEWFQR